MSCERADQAAGSPGPPAGRACFCGEPPPAKLLAPPRAASTSYLRSTSATRCKSWTRAECSASSASAAGGGCTRWVAGGCRRRLGWQCGASSLKGSCCVPQWHAGGGLGGAAAARPRPALTAAVFWPAAPPCRCRGSGQATATQYSLLTSAPASPFITTWSPVRRPST